MAARLSDRTVNWVLGAILIVLLIAVGGFAINRHDTHVALDGHPPMVERMHEAKKDIDELKTDVKEFAHEQSQQTRILERIDRNTRRSNTEGHE